MAYFIVLDTRSQKNPPSRTCTPTMLGAQQLSWMKSQLQLAKNLQFRWIFLVSSVSFDSLTKRDPPATDGAPTDMGRGGWGAFTVERNEIAKYLTDNHLCNAVWLSGDLHSGGSADDAHTGWNQNMTVFGLGVPEFGSPHVNLANNPPAGKCDLSPNQGDSGYPRKHGVGGGGMPCEVDTPNLTGEWWFGSDHATYVSGYDFGDLRAVGDSYPDGGSGFLRIDVSWSSIRVRSYKENGMTVQSNGSRLMDFTLDYINQCPRLNEPPPDPEQP